MKRALFCLLALVAALLNSCIDGEEEVFINADGSARVTAVYRVPGILFSAEDAEELRTNITEEVARQKNLKLITNRIDKENGSRVITIELATDDIIALEGTLAEHTPGINPSKADKMLHAIIGSITVNLDGLSAELSRKVDLGPLLDESLGNKSATILGDSEFRYIVHLPEPAKQSNAHVVENDGRTLKWYYKLSECHKKPIRLNMVASIPLPWWVYAAGMTGLLLLVWGGWKWVGLKSRMSQ
ncbi:MAG: hypothetical protein H7A51_06590 [Akkermansiaceae bacterium]|nr:hypothetical protein [Akkermansiaceae bacterium]